MREWLAKVAGSPRRPRSMRKRRLSQPRLCAHDVVSPRIAPELDGIRIGQISDLHVRVGVKPRRLHEAVEMLNALAPDLVALTGDYVCFSALSARQLTTALKALRVPAYAVLGNHDHNCGARKVRSALERAGIDVLVNEHRVLDLGRGLGHGLGGGRPLHLVGLDDPVTRHDDPERAFHGVPKGATSVVLAHDPNSADRLHPYSPALILSGHTHGGQVFFDRLTPYMAGRIGIKYLAGFFDVGGSHLYVTRGLGAGIPVRFRAPMEVAHLTLRHRADEAEAA